MTKKIYLLLFLCILFANQVLAQSGTYTANGVTWKYEINGTEATITGETQGADNFTGPLNIPATIIDGGNNYQVTKIGIAAFTFYKKATNIQIPNGVKTIGDAAFQWCSNCTGTLMIPNSVTYIGTSAFRFCYNLSGLVLPNGITAISETTFDGCSRLTGTITIPTGVTIIGDNAFQNCFRITGVVIPNTVTQIRDYAFLNAGGSQQGLGTVTIPGSVTYIGQMAFNGSRISKLILSPGITTIEMAAFSGNLITELTIPTGISKIGNGAFQSNSLLEKVTFEAGPSPAIFEQDIFRACPELKYIDMNAVTSPVTQVVSRLPTSLTSPFRGLSPSTMVYLPSGTSQPANDEENFVVNGACNNFNVYDRLIGVYNGFNYTSDNQDYRILYPFTAAKATYKNRTFIGTSCKTVCLPYPATVPLGMMAYELRGKTGTGKSFRFVSIIGNQMEANKPYLLCVRDNGIHTFNTDINVQVPATPPTAIEVIATADATSYFGGTTEKINNATAAGMNIYNLENDMWKPIRTDNPNGYVHSFRCYIRSTTPIPAGAKGFAIVIDNEGETTGIETAEQDLEQGQGRIYTLDGRFVGTDMDELKSGEVYVKNGRKFYKF